MRLQSLLRECTLGHNSPQQRVLECRQIANQLDSLSLQRIDLTLRMRQFVRIRLNKHAAYIEPVLRWRVCAQSGGLRLPVRQKGVVELNETRSHAFEPNEKSGVGGSD